jgi:hypothetical protein
VRPAPQRSDATDVRSQHVGRSFYAFPGIPEPTPEPSTSISVGDCGSASHSFPVLRTGRNRRRANNEPEEHAKVNEELTGRLLSFW